MTTEQISQAIAAFRKIVTPDAISPDMLGALLQGIFGRVPESFACDAGESVFTLTLTGADGQSIGVSLPRAMSNRAGILTGAQYNNFYTAEVDARHAIEWLNEFKTETAGKFDDAWEIINENRDDLRIETAERRAGDDEVRDYVDSSCQTLDRKIDTAVALRDALFDDLFRAAVGNMGYISASHCEDDGTPTPYCLNGLWLTYEEAVAVYAAGAIGSRLCGHFYEFRQIRTNLPPLVMGCLTNKDDPAFDCPNLCASSAIEVLNLNTYRGMDLSVSNSFFMIDPAVMERDAGMSMIGDCPQLREVTGIINLQRLTGDIGRRIIGDCPALEKIRLEYLKGSIDLSGAPMLSADTVRMLIEGARNTGPITVKVHSGVYTKLTRHLLEPDGTVGKNDGWGDLYELAEGKKITFLSA